MCTASEIKLKFQGNILGLLSFIAMEASPINSQNVDKDFVLSVFLSVQSVVLCVFQGGEVYLHTEGFCENIIMINDQTCCQEALYMFRCVTQDKDGVHDVLSKIFSIILICIGIVMMSNTKQIDQVHIPYTINFPPKTKWDLSYKSQNLSRLFGQPTIVKLNSNGSQNVKKVG